MSTIIPVEQATATSAPWWQVSCARWHRARGKQSRTCQFGSFWSARMNMQRHFGIVSATALREDATIRTLTDDLDRTIQVLECDIATEEERAGIFDRSDAKYPILGRTLATRRDNLKVTIAALARRLATISDKAPQAIATAA